MDFSQLRSGSGDLEGLLSVSMSSKGTVGSIKLEYGFGVICAGFPSFFWFWDQRTVFWLLLNGVSLYIVPARPTRPDSYDCSDYAV